MGGGLRLLKKHCEYPTLSNAAGRDGFAVLVHAKAPAASAAEAASSRAPLDLGSMMGEKLALVKQTTRLWEGRGQARREDPRRERMHANIRGGLDEAAKVSDDRRHGNTVSSVILPLGRPGQLQRWRRRLLPRPS